MSFRSLFSTPIFVAMFMAPVFGQSTPMPSTYNRDYVFPPVSLAAGETVQVNVANTAKSPTGGPAASCTGTISFTNASGTVIGTPAAFSVAAGQIGSASLPYMSSTTAARDSILAMVQQTVTGPVLPFQPVAATTVPCSLVLSLEIFSATTHVVLGNASVISTGLPVPVSVPPSIAP
jgi:hypothetical protein